MLATLATATAGSMIGPLPNPTRSWWLEYMPPAAAADASAIAELPARAEVVIIGAGITGCATAHWLRRLTGRTDVVVLDARGCAGGATGRNGGHLWHNPNSEFEEEVVSELLRFIRESGCECDLTLDGAAALERAAQEAGVVFHDTPDVDRYGGSNLGACCDVQCREPPAVRGRNRSRSRSRRRRWS